MIQQQPCGLRDMTQFLSCPSLNKASDEILPLWPPDEFAARLLSQTGKKKRRVSEGERFRTLLSGKTENGVFSLYKTRRAQTSDWTIRKMTMPASLYLTSPQRDVKCGWWSQPDYTKHVFMPAWVTPSAGQKRKEVKYTKRRPKWPETNVGRITGGAEEWRVCVPSPNHASWSCLWHNIRWLRRDAETVAGFDSWTTCFREAEPRHSSS